MVASWFEKFFLGSIIERWTLKLGKFSALCKDGWPNERAHCFLTSDIAWICCATMGRRDPKFVETPSENFSIPCCSIGKKRCGRWEERLLVGEFGRRSWSFIFQLWLPLAPPHSESHGCDTQPQQWHTGGGNHCSVEMKSVFGHLLIYSPCHAQQICHLQWTHGVHSWPIMVHSKSVGQCSSLKPPF